METNSSLTQICYGVTIVWIESSQGLSTALHIQISCILCRGGQLYYWGMHVKRHWRPLNSRLLIRCHIMVHLGQKEPEKIMPVLRFTTFSEVCGIHPSQRTVLIFSSKCLFNLDGLFSSNAELSIWRGDLLTVCLLLVKHPFSAQACGQVFGSFQEVLFNFYSNLNPRLTLFSGLKHILSFK